MKAKFWSVMNDGDSLIEKSKNAIYVFDTKQEAQKKVDFLNKHITVRGIIGETVFLAECEILFKKEKMVLGDDR